MVNPLTDIDFWHRNYGESVRSYPSILSRNDRELMRLLHPYMGKGKSILEMGCGNSYWLPYFAKQYNMDVAGIDFSDKRLSQTLDNINKVTHKTYSLYQEDFMSCSTKFGYNIVCSFGVVEHFDDTARVLKRFTEFLAPGGILITTVPHLKGFWGNLQRRIAEEVTTGYKEMDLDMLVKEHLNTDLDIVQAEYFRWLDFGVLNFASLAKPLQPIATGLALLNDAVVSTLIPNRCKTEEYYSDMIVVAKKHE